MSRYDLFSREDIQELYIGLKERKKKILEDIKNTKELLADDIFNNMRVALEEDLANAEYEITIIDKSLKEICEYAQSHYIHLSSNNMDDKPFQKRI